MPRTTHSVLDVFASLLAPVFDAYTAETGRTVTRPTVTRHQFAGALRTLAALLRVLASRIDRAPVAPTVPASAPVQTAPETVPTATDPQPEPEPVNVWGMTCAEFSAFDRWVTDQEAATLAPVTESAPVQATNPQPAPSPTPVVAEEPAPVQPARKPRTRKSKSAPVQVEAPAKVWNVTTIASVHGIPAKTLRNHLASGRLLGSKGADGWTVEDRDLLTYLATRSTEASK